MDKMNIQTAYMTQENINMRELKITDLDLNTRIINSLKRADIETVEELVNLKILDKQLKLSMGEKAFAEIEDKLKVYGLSLIEPKDINPIIYSLPTKVKNLLFRNQVKTDIEFLELTDEKIFQLKGAGEKTIATIIAKVKEMRIK